VRLLRLARDDRRVLTARLDPASGAKDLWLLDTVRGTSTRLTATRADERPGALTLDGEQVFYSTDVGGQFALAKRAVDALSEQTVLLAEPGADWVVEDLSPDGRMAVASRETERTSVDIWLVPLDNANERRPWLATEFSEDLPRYSPDGAWIAFQSDRSGRNEVYLRRTSGGPLLQVSTEGGRSARFRADGRALYFVGPGLRLYKASLSPQAGEVVPGRPELLGAIDTAGLLDFDVARDGRLLVLRRVSGGIDTFRVLLGWRARIERAEGAGDAAGQR
jgi:Tol biopolymer transport system component